MGIPKIIHYCWFGGNELSERAAECIDSWRRFCPDYEIREWNEQNYDVSRVPYIRDAYKEKKWAFVSDYVRLDVVYRYGGIYLDTDVELIKSLSFFEDQMLFMAMEKQNSYINTGLGFGAVAGNEKIRQLREVYHRLSFYREDGSLNLVACPKYTTDFFVKWGFQVKDITQKCGEAIIYSSEYFCPMDYNTGKINITKNTYGIHWYEASWFPESDKKIHEMELRIRKKYSDNVAGLFCIIYRNGYRFFEYLKKGVLLKRIREKIQNHNT